MQQQPANGKESGSCSGRPVDLVHLARHAMGDAELEREVLRLFVTQSLIYLERIKQAHDTTSWRAAAHTLKGSARGIGAWGVATRAENLEGLGFDPQAECCRHAISALESEIDRANHYIRSLFTAH